MKNLMAIIKSTFETKNYGPLLNSRPDYMLPFGSRYRVIDFMLSNFREHGIFKVLLHGGENIRSTLDHVGNGKHWEMDKRNDGLVIDAPLTNRFIGNSERIASYYDSFHFIEHSKHEHIYIANPMVLGKINITEAYNKYLENEYDVIFLYSRQEDKNGEFLNSRKIVLDENGNIINVGVNLGTESVVNIFIDQLIIKKEVFKEIITDSLEKENARTIVEAVMNNRGKLKIGVYEVKNHIEYIRDLNSFYRANLNLLNVGIYADLFLMGTGVLTKNKDEPSTMYKEGNKVSNSIIANGCILEGEVSDSVLFRGVQIGKNAIVKNSILFQGVKVEDGAIIVNSVIDKYAVIKKNVFVQGTTSNPYVVPKDEILEK